MPTFKDKLYRAHYKPPKFAWAPLDVFDVAGVPTAFHDRGPYAGQLFDVAHYSPPARVTYYVGYPGGSDSKTGASTAQSFASIGKAFTKTDMGTISLYPKYYNKDIGKFSAVNQSFNLIADTASNPGVACRIGADATLTWALNTDCTYTYKATRTSALAAFDESTLDANGHFTMLVKDASYAGGDLAPGHWYTDGSYVYARAADSRDIIGDTTLHIYLAASGCAASGAFTGYAENITWEGGGYAFRAYATDATHQPAFFAKGCKFLYAPQYNGLAIEGGVAYLQNCQSWQNYADAFNYHAAYGVICRFIEVGCTGRNTGWGLSGNNNGSTAHDACQGVRIGTIAHDTDGPAIVDVNPNTLTWNVGCNAYNAKAGEANYQSQCSGNGAMYLDACTSGAGDRDMLANVAGRLYHINCIGMDTRVELTNGSIKRYSPLWKV